MHRIRLFFLLAALALGGCSKSETPQEAATHFLQLCEQGKAADAYRSASTDFKLQRSLKYFEARVRELGFDRGQSPAWSTPVQNGQAQVVTGEYPFADGVKLPLEIAMVREGSAWRVLEARAIPDNGKGQDLFAVNYVGGDGKQLAENRTFVEPLSTAAPTPEQTQVLIQETILKFDRCVKAQDFTEFFDYVSEQWKNRGTGTVRTAKNFDLDNDERRLTKTALENAFRKFMDIHADFSEVKGKKAVLDAPPFITSTGVLTMMGGFDTFIFVGENPPTPRKLRFKIEYVMENSAWRVFGLSLELK